MKAPCPIEKSAKLLSDPWTMLIVRDVLRSPQRFCELERSLVGISTRTLTAKLKNLESQNILRKARDGSYMPTAKGKALRSIEEAMETYGKKYL